MPSRMLARDPSASGLTGPAGSPPNDKDAFSGGFVMAPSSRQILLRGLAGMLSPRQKGMHRWMTKELATCDAARHHRGPREGSRASEATEYASAWMCRQSSKRPNDGNTQGFEHARPTGGS